MKKIIVLASVLGIFSCMFSPSTDVLVASQKTNTADVVELSTPTKSLKRNGVDTIKIEANVFEKDAEIYSFDIYMELTGIEDVLAVRYLVSGGEYGMWDGAFNYVDYDGDGEKELIIVTYGITDLPGKASRLLEIDVLTEDTPFATMGFERYAANEFAFAYPETVYLFDLFKWGFSFENL